MVDENWEVKLGGEIREVKFLGAEFEVSSSHDVKMGHYRIKLTQPNPAEAGVWVWAELGKFML